MLSRCLACKSRPPLQRSSPVEQLARPCASAHHHNTSRRQAIVRPALFFRRHLCGSSRKEGCGGQRLFDEDGRGKRRRRVENYAAVCCASPFLLWLRTQGWGRRIRARCFNRPPWTSTRYFSSEFYSAASGTAQGDVSWSTYGRRLLFLLLATTRRDKGHLYG